MERRLAAILAADVFGYSRMMSEDETGTLALLQSHRSQLLDPAITRHHGRIVKLMGDGLLAEFPAWSRRSIARPRFSARWQRAMLVLRTSAR